MKKESFKFHFNFSILCVKVVTRYTMTGSLSVVLAVVLAAQLMVETEFGQIVTALAVALMAQQVVFAILLKTAMRNQSPLSFCLLALLTLRENLLRFEIPS